MDDYDHLMTNEEAAAFLQVHPQTMTAWRRRKFGPKWIGIGYNIRYIKAHLVEWLNLRTVDPNVKVEPNINAEPKPIKLPKMSSRLREILDLPRVPKGRPKMKTA